jgi:GntR family transcriptional regulator
MPNRGPRWKTTADRLRAMLYAGAFADGRLESEPDIAKRLGVSRSTARQALASLEHAGLLIRKQGSGTYVNSTILQMPSRLDEVWDFAEMIERSGHQPGVRHLSMRLEPASALFCEKLRLAPGAEVIAVANLFLADERPVIDCLDVIPGHLVRAAYAPEELHGPIYTFLGRRCQQQVSYNITEVRPVVAGEELAKQLGCRAGAPLHYFDEIGFNAEHTPILYSQEYYLPDAFRFHIVRKLTTSRRAAPARKAPRAVRPKKPRSPNGPGTSA